MIDLHNHTHYSDGSLSPNELIDLAIESNVTQLAITDHDSVEGLLELQKSSSLLPDGVAFDSSQALQIIKGVEISANWGKQGVHIVGLDIDPYHLGLQAFLKQQQDGRKVRALQIANKLQKLGMDHIVDDVDYLIESQPMVCRPHIAQLLIERGEVKNFADAFKKYLGKGAKAFVKDDWFSLQDAIKIIASAGGVSVLAHPMRYGISTNRLKDLIAEYALAGGDALEICYPNINPGHKNLLASWANQHSLLASQGSDFHSPDKAWVKLGKFPPLPNDVTPVWSVWT